MSPSSGRKPVADVAAVRHRVSEAVDDHLVRVLALVFLIAQVLDVGTTLTALRVPGLREGNPLVTGLPGGGIGTAIVVKLMLAVVAVIAVLGGVSRPRRLPVLVVMVAVSLEAPVVNALHLLGM